MCRPVGSRNSCVTLLELGFLDISITIVEAKQGFLLHITQTIYRLLPVGYRGRFSVYENYPAQLLICCSLLSCTPASLVVGTGHTAMRKEDRLLCGILLPHSLSPSMFEISIMIYISAARRQYLGAL